MIFKEFPDLRWLKQQAEKKFSDRKAYDGTVLKQGGWPTVILNVNSGQVYRDNIKGPLSVFTNLSGECQVTVNGKPSLIKEGFFFLSNPEQHYTLEIHPSTPAETFNIHFGEHFADQVFHSLQNSAESLLDQTFEPNTRRVEFYNRINFRTPEINIILREIQNQQLSSTALEEKLYDLIHEFLIHERLLQVQSKALPVIKSSTREEIFRRLLLATDYIYSYFDQDLSLDELAAASCLSKFHFLRLFKIMYRKTPYQFINEVRVKKAQSLLKNSSLEVNEIASSLGFVNASSFSRMFYQQTGHYPSATPRSSKGEVKGKSTHK
jgi:AraC family transcriptional regulator